MPIAFLEIYNISRVAGTYNQVYIHAVFAVKYRKAIIQDEWKAKFHKKIAGLINDTGCKTIIVNGVEDHVHCFFNLKNTVSISQVMKVAKAKSTRWLNKSGLLDHRFAWQAGYGSFSYSYSQLDKVCKYIRNQEEHHKKQDFKEEYVNMLNKFNVPFEERYIFEELID